MSLEMSTSRVTATGVEVPVEQIRQEHGAELDAIARFRRVTNYLAAAQIYLKDNVLLREPLKPEHIKDRLLGHWGTSPGINLVYAHLNHLYPGIPGTIHEGGELGYALATAFGAAMDNPDLIVACIVGDGEAETGPTATAWHSYKFLDPVESGAVLPIVHLNGYKISNPTIYGTMSDDELLELFTGYGYQVIFVEGDDLDASLYGAIDYAYQEIRRIQQAARSGQPIEKPRWPVILMRSPKGMTAPTEMDGQPIVGSYRSHQVPITDPKTNPEHLKLLEGWLRSYHVEELFDEHGR